MQNSQRDTRSSPGALERTIAKVLTGQKALVAGANSVRVNGIAPGAIRTPINTSAWATEEAYVQLMTLVPYKRIGEPEDIAPVVVWLASDDFDHVVGTALLVDGGMTLYPDFTEGG